MTAAVVIVYTGNNPVYKHEGLTKRIFFQVVFNSCIEYLLPRFTRAFKDFSDIMYIGINAKI